MATTADYLNQLKNDKQILVNNLIEKGVDATNEETFTELVPKVLDISSSSTEYNALLNDNPTGSFSSATSSMANLARQLFKLLPELDVSNVTDASYMFYNCQNIQEIKTKTDLNASCTDFDNVFSGCSSMVKADISSIVGENLEQINQAFVGCSSLTEVNMANLNPKALTKCSGLFSGCSSLMKVDIRNIDFTSITNFTDKVNTFNGVPSDCQIIVKDQANKDWVLGVRGDLNNVVVYSEL